MTHLEIVLSQRQRRPIQDGILQSFMRTQLVLNQPTELHANLANVVQPFDLEPKSWRTEGGGDKLRGSRKSLGLGWRAG